MCGLISACMALPQLRQRGRKNITPLCLAIAQISQSSAPGAILVSMLGIFEQAPPSARKDPHGEKLDPKLLLLTPHPRVVKMGWPIRVQIIVGGICLALFVIWFNQAIPNIKTATAIRLSAPVFILACLLGVALAVILEDLRELRLLQSGNCVMGRVVDKIKAAGGRGRRTLLVYQFAVGPGKPMTAKGTDYTKSRAINSPVLVFFDPNRLEKHVALCSTGWTVYDESGRLIEP
jgi:hypothetical protein